MKTFTNQEKGYRKQLAVGYVVYMMGGSYFKTCTCKNKIEEKHLFLHYSEMPKQKQMDLETKILRMMDKLDKEFLMKIENLRCEVHFKHNEEGYQIEFKTGGFESLLCNIQEDGEVLFEIL